MTMKESKGIIFQEKGIGLVSEGEELTTEILVEWEGEEVEVEVDREVEVEVESDTGSEMMEEEGLD